MEQHRPRLITTEEKAKLPILIVDKKGIIGSALAKMLREQFLLVIVTAHELERHRNIIHIPYRRKIPKIPDNPYSHLFVIYNGEEELLDMLSSFEKKAEAVNARFLFVTSLLYSSKRLFAKLRRPEYHLLQIALFGEIFENTITDANEINFYIHQARAYGRIEVPEEGLGKLYPIFLDDVLTSLISLAFAVERPKEPIFLFPHYEYNQISIARMIQKIDPLVKFDFSKKKTKAREYYVPPGGLYFFRNYNLEDRLRKIDFSRIGHRTKPPQKKIRLKLEQPSVNNNSLKLAFAIFFAVFIMPILVVFIAFLIGILTIGLSAKQLEQGNLQAAKTNASISRVSFATGQILSPSLFLPQVLLSSQTKQFADMIQTGRTIAMTEISFIQTAQALQDIYKGQSTDPKNDFLHAQATLKNILLTVQKLEAEKKLPPSVQRKLQTVDGVTNLVEETIDTWPQLLGFEGKKTYLILFQNNMELRPGGGFIGSYGILPIANGRVGKLQISDVYDADGHLKEHVQPPYGLQRYVGMSHWFLRDSNFDPDFTRDSILARQFLQKETGQKVDGVIAIDTNFLKNLIAVVGSVDVLDYKVTVTPDNFYLLTESHAEKNFFPGSTQKKDFLRSLTNALLEKLSARKNISYEKLAQMLLTSIQQKDVLFSFTDMGIQNVFTANGLSSSLWDERTPEKNTAFDYFGVVDANVGANKANYYLKRSIHQSTAIDALNGLQTTADITYTNTSTKTSPFGGDYKDYVQFLVPANATLISVAFDNKEVQTVPAITDPEVFTSPDFIPPTSLEVAQTEEIGKTVIGFFFIVPTGATRTVSITYTTPSPIEKGAVAYSFNLRLFKQPGSGNDPYQLSFSYPNDVMVVSKDGALTDVGGKLIYDGQLSEDKNITASFSKK